MLLRAQALFAQVAQVARGAFVALEPDYDDGDKANRSGNAGPGEEMTARVFTRQLGRAHAHMFCGGKDPELVMQAILRASRFWTFVHLTLRAHDVGGLQVLATTSPADGAQLDLEGQGVSRKMQCCTPSCIGSPRSAAGSAGHNCRNMKLIGRRPGLWKNVDYPFRRPKRRFQIGVIERCRDVNASERYPSLGRSDGRQAFDATSHAHAGLAIRRTM